MNLFKFVKTAGEMVSDFITGDGKIEDAIKERVKQLSLSVQNFNVQVNGDEAVLSGVAESRDVYEKAILAAGNIKGIETVNSKMTIKQVSQTSSGNQQNASNANARQTMENQNTTQAYAAGMNEKSENSPQPTFYRVQAGDTLSKISKQFYGDANQYNKIFEANRPMLKSPDSIYPDQTLRIPDMEEKGKAAA